MTFFLTKETVMKRNGLAGAPYWRHAVRAAGLSVAVGTLLTVHLAAQRNAQGGGTPHLNTIIERFEADLPSFNGEHWNNLPGIEHNPFAYPLVEEALAALRPEGSTQPMGFPVVRIDFEGFQEYNHLVTGLLNRGLGGIILPMVETIPEITKFVATMRHPPQRTTPDNLRYPYGTRGWNAGAATRYWGLESDQYVTIADVWPLNPQGELMALIMIETPEMVHMIRDVLSVPGLSGVLVGQGDLSIRLGVGTPAANQFHPEVEALVAQVAAACVDMGKLCGSYQSPPEGACPDSVCGQAYRVKQGFRIFTSGRGNYTGP
jgi:2-keto-3-deoxy-L-rhamnonate aldolase RhmA